jgi:hypothetical protein
MAFLSLLRTLKRTLPAAIGAATAGHAATAVEFSAGVERR